LDKDKLKALNRPENYLSNYHLEVPLFAIPPETLENLLKLLTEIALRQAPMQEQIGQLPTWADVQNEIVPAIEAAQEQQKSALRDGLGRIESATNRAFREQQAALSKTVTDGTKHLEQQLRMKDFTPWKTKLLWWAAGTALPLILWGLLWIFKIW
jgi:hypothetical protein